jgi:glycine betaine/proline transport system substrate-binding protein
MAEINYSSQMIQTEIGRRVLDHMGYEVNKKAMDAAATFPAMARSDNTITIETWAGLLRDPVEEFVNQKKEVVDYGPNGTTGEEGWYVPTYVIEGDADRGIEPMCPGLPDYRALNDCVDVFKTATTGSQGRYLSGAKAWGKIYGDDRRIRNLDLNYKMEFAGSEAALVAEIKRAHDRGEPILSLMWRPHFLTSQYDMTMVEFPEYSDECWATTRACSWPPIDIRKFASSAFEEARPTAAAFLKEYSLSDEDLGKMLIAYEEEGKSVEEVVDEWMQAKPDVWEAWIPQKPGA